MGKKQKTNSGKTSYIFTRETFGMTLLLFSAIVFIMLCSGSAVFAGIGKAVCTFMYGTFGFGSFLVLFLCAYLGEWLVFEKSIPVNFRQIITISLTTLSLFLLFHAVTTRDYALEGYGKYIADCYMNAQNGFFGYTFGGVVSSIIVYPIAKAGGFVTAYVLFSILVLPFGYLTFMAFKRGGVKARKEKEVKYDEKQEEEESVPEAYEEQYYAEPQPQPKPQPEVKKVYAQNQPDNKYSQENLGKKILFEKGEFDAESYRRNRIFNENSYFNNVTMSEEDYLSSFSSTPKKPKTYTESYQEDIYNSQSSMPQSYVYGEKPVEQLNDYAPEKPVEQFGGYTPEQPVEQFNGYVPEKPVEQFNGYTPEKPVEQFNVYTPEKPVEQFGEKPTQEKPAEDIFNRRNTEIPPVETNYVPPVNPVNDVKDKESFVRPTRDRSAVGFTDPDKSRRDERNYEEIIKEEEPEHDDVDEFLRGNNRGGDITPRRPERSKADLFDGDDDKVDEIFAPRRTEPKIETPRPIVRREPEQVEKDKTEQKPEETVEQKPKHVWKKYVRPTLDLLRDYPENNNVNTGEIEDNKRIIVETLEKFKIASEIANVTTGPAITRYDVIIEDKTNIKRSLGYRDAIAMELRKDNVNAYLNYSKGALSIEVPNNKRAIVGLKTMLTSPQFLNSKPNALTFGFGKNVDGEVICPDITKMPHLLVAGTTGSGKSICLSALIVSLLYKYGPEDLRLILVDPKQSEFIMYNRLPHLMINEILYECDKVIKALNWAIKEMERRYTLFKDMTEAGVATKNLDEYNSHLPEGEERLPKIVMILDEFGDLMLQAKKDIESRIIRLVQKARACGIHLILATQRPSVDCITGLIKSNLPTRIGFKVNSFDDARCIFDIGGAEKLLGMGDSYYRSAQNPELTRIQGCFIDTPEVQAVTDFIKANNETYFDQSVSDYINTVEQEEKPATVNGGEDDAETKIDDTFIKALKYCVTSNQASVSMLQRRFPVGYIKACKIIDWMENMTYVTPSEGSKPRKVLLSKEEFFNIYGDVDD